MNPVSRTPVTRRYSLVVYLAVTFGLSWGLLAISVIAAATHNTPPVPDALLITLATLGPALGAIAASWYEAGRSGVYPLLVQARRWRVGRGWYALVIGGPGLVMLGGFVFWLALGGPALPAPPAAAWPAVPILMGVLLLPALFEEIGWRGYLLPQLQSRWGILPAALTVGAVHAVWHLPIFFIPSAGFGTLPFAVFAAFVLALGIVMAWVYNGTGGSVLLVALLHAALNAWPVPWTAATSLLPEGARGLHVQIPMTLALAIWALWVARRAQAAYPATAAVEALAG